MASVIDAESFLAIDIGSTTTRALLFDVVDGTYHFLAAGSAPSTWAAPFHDVGEGVHLALTRLQEITSRPLMDEGSRLILPTRSDGSGVDRLALTLSAGADVRMVIIGLLEEVSLASARRLASTTYGKVVESLGLNDHRRQDAQLDALLQANADFFILAGGTEQGATRSVSKLVELVLLALKTMRQESRPKILYCGNQALTKKLKEVLSRYTEVFTAPNIRPTFDQEDLVPAADALAKMTVSLRGQQFGGLSGLGQLTATPVQPTATATLRLMRFLSELYDPAKGVLGVEVGSHATYLAGAIGGRERLKVFRPLGNGLGMEGTLERISPADVARWVPMEVSTQEVEDYLWQKSLFPATIPVTATTLAIEQGLVREILRYAAQAYLEDYPDCAMTFEPIFAGGAALAQTGSPVQSLLMLLDGLQPTGVSTLFLDPYGLMPALGAIAGANSLLPVQILESGAFQNLGAVICPVSDAKPGTPILKARVVFEDGNEVKVDVKQGSLVPLPIRHGQSARLYLEALRGTEIDPRRKTAGGFKIVGGLCGAVIDARGRPLTLPAEPNRRRELLLRWTQALETRRPV